MKQLRSFIMIAACFLLAPAAANAAAITFSGSFIPAFSPSSVEFTFATFVPAGLYSEATLTGSITVTPALRSGDASAELHPSHSSFFSGSGFDGLTGTPLVGLGLVPCLATGGSPTICDFGTTTVTFAPTFFDSMRAVIAFEQFGVGSTVEFSGSLELTEADASIPEPATGLLLLASAAVTALGARRRQRRG